MTTNVVVGAGQAGVHAATAMRRSGVAGRIVLVGEEQSLPYERPPLSKAYLSSPDDIKLDHFYEPGEFSRLDIDVITGVRVESINAAAKTISLTLGGELSYDALILATGSRPRRLQFPGAERALHLRTFDDAELLRSRLAPGVSVLCIGAGVIGLEVAASARQRGCVVTVVDVAETVMGRSLDRAMASRVRELHESRGVRFVLGASVTELNDTHAVLSSGETIAADVVLFGIGVERRTDIARAAGIAVDRGILVDERGRTSEPDIYAAGEVAEFFLGQTGKHQTMESWRHAQDHGAFVGRVVGGTDEDYALSSWFWSDQYDVNLQFVGVTAGNEIATSVRRPASENADCTFYLDGNDLVIGAIGWNTPKDIMAATRIIAQARPIEAARLADPDVQLRSFVGRSAVVSA